MSVTFSTCNVFNSLHGFNDGEQDFEMAAKGLNGPTVYIAFAVAMCDALAEQGHLHMFGHPAGASPRHFDIIERTRMRRNAWTIRFDPCMAAMKNQGWAAKRRTSAITNSRRLLARFHKPRANAPLSYNTKICSATKCTLPSLGDRKAKRGRDLQP